MFEWSNSDLILRVGWIIAMDGLSYLRCVASILIFFSYDIFFPELRGSIIRLLESQQQECFLLKEGKYEGDI